MKDRKDRLLEIGADILSRDALATLADVSRAAGMAKSVIHYYWPEGKGAFVRDAYAWAVERDRATHGLHAGAIVLAQRDARLAEYVRKHAPILLQVDAAMVGTVARAAAE